MKVGLITGGHQKTSTGIGNYIFNLITKLPIPRENISIIRHPLGYNYDLPNQIVPWSPKWSNMMLWSWATYIQKDKYKDLDIVHSPTLCLFPKKPHHKFILTVHDTVFKKYPEYCTKEITRYTSLFFYQNLLFADKIISVSNATKQDLITIYNIPESKIIVIHEAASTVFKPLNAIEIARIREKYNLNNKFILYVGTIEPRKNIPYLIKSFYECLKWIPDITLVLAGGLGWKYEDIFSTIEELGIKEKVRLLGYVPDSDLPALYTASRVFVMPSIYEGFGLPVLEAMQSGTPVITSNCSSFPEIVGDGGLMVDPNNVFVFAKLITKIIIDDDFYKKQREYGIMRAKNFSWERTAESTYQTYKEVLRI